MRAKDRIRRIAVDRPVMNPTIAVEESHPKRPWYEMLRPAWRGIRWSARLLVADIFARQKKLQADLKAPVSRFMRGLCYRLLFLPLGLMLMAAALVYNGTHPSAAAPIIDPSCHGMNYDVVDYFGDGGVKLEGWLIPILDAKRVIAEKDKTLADRRPAVVLLHDYGASRQQMLPLVRPLHDAGYVVLLTTLRGGATGSPAGSTFGLNEAGDAQAAVALLRRTPFVDGRKIAVIGLGTGANAAMLVAQKDTSIAAIVLDKPFRGFDDVLRERIGPSQHWMQWMNPMCEWAFEVAYGVNASDLNLQQSFHTLEGRNTTLPVLLFDAPHPTCLQPSKTAAIIDFLDASLGVKKAREASQSADASGSRAS